jgi:ubiquinone/menaquinone biosynthesis C-methylase UbiE
LEIKDSKQFYENEALSYDKRRWNTPAGQMINNTQMEIFKLFVGDLADLNILEIAAGTGRFTEKLLEKNNSVTALDISSAMLNKLKERLLISPNHGNLHVLVGDARQIQLESATMDLVVCLNALSHIPEHDKVIKEVYRILKPGGIFVFNFPNYNSLYWPFGMYVNFRKTSVTRKVYTKWYTLQGISKDLGDTGFKIGLLNGQLHVPTMTPALFVPFARYIDKNLREGMSMRCAPIIFVRAKK